jgi:4-diphosphocytidyl-2-C-methyl-D-erythritol kinase
MLDVVTVRAPAKVNLALAVGAARADGYHPICSWMVTFDLFDELEVKRLLPDRFSRYAILWHADARRRSDIDWPITKDLAVRAHLALQRRLARPLPVQVRLEKRIPVGGGLGGGSSNAAAMLRALNELFDLRLRVADLADVGREIGADVPFLVHGGSAIVEGVGEEVSVHAHVPELHVVLAFPDARCPTADVYRRFDEGAAADLRASAVRALAAGAMGRRPRPEDLFNDLTAAAVGVAPAIGRCIAGIAEIAERPAHVSGSGSTIFVLCDDALHAEHLARAIEDRTGLPTVAVRSVG